MEKITQYITIYTKQGEELNLIKEENQYIVNEFKQFVEIDDIDYLIKTFGLFNKEMLDEIAKKYDLIIEAKCVNYETTNANEYLDYYFGYVTNGNENFLCGIKDDFNENCYIDDVDMFQFKEEYKNKRYYYDVIDYLQDSLNKKLNNVIEELKK